MNSSAPDGTRDLRLLWRRFEGWLRANAPGDFSVLRPGVPASEVSALENEIGFSLHSELRSLLEAVDGVTPRRSSMEPGAFFVGYSPLASDKILESHLYLVSMARDAVEDGYEEEVVGRTAHRQWVPFAGSVTGDLLFVDHRPGHFGEIGEVSFGDPEYVRLWPSLSLMLDDLCNAVEGMTQLPAVRRSPSVHDNRMLEWVTG
ncbi:SMI1/KNR4 family protein [Streptomyces sp. NBC_01341]|uniref:SMI1/KNR4 family protein n=1 Tax=Streptomyces sp. NBC_01341 TaxID=2903831 RepID=UPI002E15F454|nr:SMI1/KNR4 family protein [Streptomyces sp. NBC_01341]